MHDTHSIPDLAPGRSIRETTKTNTNTFQQNHGNSVIMGANLSAEKITTVDTSKDVISPEDRFSEILLGLFWLGSFYGIGMIFCAVKLLGRWAGPNGERGFNIFSVIAAFLMATAWPLVLVYLAMQDR